MTDAVPTAIVGARVFDGFAAQDGLTVELAGGRIVAVHSGGPAAGGGTTVPAGGCTLMPGFIDAHVHTSVEGLREALMFGVTTELEMQGHWTAQQRAAIRDRHDLADLRSAGFGITRRGGHPSHWFPEHRYPGVGDLAVNGEEYLPPFVDTVRDAERMVGHLARTGSDYVKIMIEDGAVLGTPGLPVLPPDVARAAVQAAHALGLIVVAHALTVRAATTAVEAGVDGLTHLFIDEPCPPELAALIAARGVFVVPCLVLNASILGGSAAELAADRRVADRLGKHALTLLHAAFDTFPQGDFVDVLHAVAQLHAAGVDLLAGTDASPRVGGVAHGASVHHELRLLGDAGLSPVQALRSATSTPARRFSLLDRGRIAEGLRADLVLVAGDPTVNLDDTLNIRQVWRSGVAMTPEVHA
ncbi:amidohydrolase family protein [Dactylosporangium sp. CA-092794]|uniref:amidohydrolase family protein n=1 Tax=Dactylosporangium sp. CA-092794 TaxID=3239929 RepID=UPI003D93C3E2